jgi:catechol 2,3-dioxygenase-like lactoylglutathione lyase family enzyme
MCTQTDIYPMPSFPTLSVRDLKRSRDFYVETLGFSHVFSMPGTDGKTQIEHVRFCRYADLLLRQLQPDEGMPGSTGVTLTFSAAVADRTCLEIAERVQDREGRIEKPVDRPWNVHELRIIDPDGYVLLFVEPLDADKTMADVLKDITRYGQR